MRVLGISSVAAALCVCCVLPSFDAVDRLPGEGSGGDSSSAGSSTAGTNPTQASGGKSNVGGSGIGAEGGEPGGVGEAGSGGSEPMAGSGGFAGSGGSAMSGASMGGAAGNSGSGGSSGSGGGGGAGGSMSGLPECNTFCQGADGLLIRCEGYLGPDIASEAGCQAACNASPASSLDCWQTHLDNVVAGLSAAVHCNHASGKVGNGVCPDRPMP